MQQGNKKLFIILGAVAGGLCLCCGAGVVAMAVIGDKATEKFDPLQAACQGSGVPAAGEYTSGPGPHRVGIFKPFMGSLSWDRSLVRTEWRPTEVTHTELVLCMGDRQEMEIEHCEYESGFLDGQNMIVRVQYARDVRLIAARSGEELSAARLQGEAPDECPVEAEFDRGDDTQRITGDDVGQTAVEAYLLPYVTGQAPSRETFAPTAPGGTEGPN